MNKYEISYCNKATINTGNYENLSPLFSLKRIIESETSPNLIQEFELMKLVVDTQLEEYIESQKKKDTPDIRTYDVNGRKYPSVTSIITPTMPKIANLDLYGVRGDFLHKILEKMIKEGFYEFSPTKELLEKLKPIGGLEDYDLEWIYKDPKFDFRGSEIQVQNDDEVYCGTYDADGLYDFKPALFDGTSSKLNKQAIDRKFMQLAAYKNCGVDADVLVIIPFNPKDKPEPIVTDKIDFYYGRFIERRKQFKSEYHL